MGADSQPWRAHFRDHHLVAKVGRLDRSMNTESAEDGLRGMKIEVLYFEDCPNHLPTLERIHQVLLEEGSDAEVKEVLVPDVETARSARFIGSPSVRVNGVDIEPAANDRRDFGLMCRRYTNGIPSHELIREAVRSASRIGGAAE